MLSRKVTNYQSKLRNIPEERNSHLHIDASWKPRILGNQFLYKKFRFVPLCDRVSRDILLTKSCCVDCALTATDMHVCIRRNSLHFHYLRPILLLLFFFYCNWVFTRWQ
jgi:hypothetical protein